MMSRSAFAIGVVVLAAGVTASAQSLPSSCGDAGAQFKVKTEKKQPMPGAPDAGMARIVFVETLDGAFPSGPTVRFADSGKWVGATKGNSYFSISVAPGDHRICGSRQASARADKENFGEVMLHASAGKTYYVQFKLMRNEIGDAAMKGGAALPGQYPGSMTAKEKPTSDSATITEVGESDATPLLPNLPLSSGTAK